MTIAAGLTASEISASITKPGGMMVYMEEIYGEKIGFLTGWVQGNIICTCNSGSIRNNICSRVCFFTRNAKQNLYVIAIAI